MKIWQLFGALAVLAGIGAVANLVVSGWPNENTLGAGIGFVLLSIPAVLMYRRDRRHRQLDAAGAVHPLVDPEREEAPPSSPAAAGAWSLDRVAAVLATELAEFNAVVFRVPGEDELRVMIDPPTAITLDQHLRTSHRDRDREASWVGQWWQLRWRPASAPQIESQTTELSAALDDDGRLVPVWSGATGTPSQQRLATLQAVRTGTAAAGAADFTFTSTALVDLVDRLAVRAGWASEADIAAVDRTVDFLEINVQRSVDGGGTLHTESSRNSIPPDARERMLASLPVEQRRLAAMAPEERVAAMRAGIAESNRSLVRIMTMVGLGVLGACLLATIIGLIAGMVWWASFIIIGSGIVFCLIFVLPLRLVAGRST